MSLAWPGRKQANVSVRMAWISFGALPCKENNWMIARVSILLKSRASLTCFRVCFLPGRAKDLSAPRYIYIYVCVCVACTKLSCYKNFLANWYISTSASCEIQFITMDWYLLQPYDSQSDHQARFSQDSTENAFKILRPETGLKWRRKKSCCNFELEVVYRLGWVIIKPTLALYLHDISKETVTVSDKWCQIVLAAGGGLLVLHD